MIAILDAARAGLLARRYWARNCIAGVIVGVVALPLAMAFAIASGVKPQQGIYTAIVAGIAVALFGGSRLQIAGPTGAFIVILAGITTRFGVDGLLLATFMGGAMLVLLGVARLGGVIRYIPAPVIAGFTAGIAVIIWVGEWSDFFGLPSIAAPHLHTKVWHLLGLLPQLHPATTVLAALGLALTLGTSRVPGCSRVPGPLVALLLVSLLQAIFQFDGVATIGSAFGGIPMGFPAPSLPVVSYERVVLLLPAAFTIMMLGAIESLLSAVVADGMAGTRHDSSQELIGQGIANMLAPLFGGIAATGALARTATNVRNGANSPLAGVVHALTLLLVLLCAAPLAARIPLCVLAAILFVVAWNMSDARHFLRLLRTAPRADAVIALITFVLTLLTDLIVAVNIGVILAMLQFMRRMAASVEVLQVSDAQLQGELASIGRDALRPGVVVYAIHGPMFFAAVETLQRALAQTRSDPRALVIRLARVPFMDSTGIDALAGAIQDLERRDVRVVLCEANERVLRKLQNAGLISKDASPRYADSLAAAADQLINSAGI